MKIHESSKLASNVCLKSQPGLVFEWMEVKKESFSILVSVSSNHFGSDPVHETSKGSVDIKVSLRPNRDRMEKHSFG